MSKIDNPNWKKAQTYKEGKRKHSKAYTAPKKKRRK